MSRCLIVLGARVHLDGRPSKALLARANLAVRLWQAGDCLILTGGGKSGAPAEADIAAEALPESSELPSTAADEESADAAEELAPSTDADQVASVEPMAAKLPVVSAGQGGGDRVQLASYGTEERAQTAWSEFETDLADILGSHVPMIEEAVLDSGTFYRLQIASFETTVEARDFCALVLERRLECIVVPR